MQALSTLPTEARPLESEIRGLAPSSSAAPLRARMSGFLRSSIRCRSAGPHALGRWQMESSRSGVLIGLLTIEPHECTKHPPEAVLIQTADQAPTVRDGDVTGLFRDNHGKRIRILGHADGRAVSRSQLTGCRNIVGERQDDACRDDAVAARQYGAVMQRRIWIE